MLDISDDICVSLSAFWLGTVAENDETGSIKLLAKQINSFQSYINRDYRELPDIGI